MIFMALPQSGSNIITVEKCACNSCIRHARIIALRMINIA